MRVESLALEDFRNYESAQIELGSGLNLVVGRNAQGKTNLLEALYCLGGFGSPRGADALLVKRGAERALLHGRVARGDRVVSIDLEVRPGRGIRALLNRTPIGSPRSLSEILTAVFFGPDELSLIKGSPEGRRRFLDELVVKLRPAREGLRREWERVLRQRNALLKSAPRGSHRAPPATLEIWDEAFCTAGANLAATRLSALGELAPLADERYRSIAGGGHLELAYASSWLDPGRAEIPVEELIGVEGEKVRPALAAALAAARPRELERGISLVGPQRDDVVVRTGRRGEEALDARSFGSQGDQRSAALALKLAEYDLLSTSLGLRPVLLLDDVFSELDPARRAWLADAVRSAGQSVLSSAEPGAAEAAEAERVFEVIAGEVVARG